MKCQRTKVIATFRISITDKDYNYSYYDITEKLWSDDEGKVTEDVVNEWEETIKESKLKTDYTVLECAVICTAFFKLDT